MIADGGGLVDGNQRPFVLIVARLPAAFALTFWFVGVRMLATGRQRRILRGLAQSGFKFGNSAFIMVKDGPHHTESQAAKRRVLRQ